MVHNPLLKWYVEQKRKRDSIVKKYGLHTPYEIADFFTYSNLSKLEPDYCPLFSKGQKCHDMPAEELVCYFCGCPYYDYEYYNEERQEYGRCKINSIYGKRNEYGYWDCTKCLLPHRKSFVIKFIKKNHI